MKLADYQAFTRTTAIYPADRALEYLALGLASEAGEVAGVVKKWIRDGAAEDVLRDKLSAEMGDVCWYLAELCNAAGLDLAEVFAANRTKLEDRRDRGVIGGSGDLR
ncbi:MAG: nucleoside triphosphate pyrophosphohydrolase family protein [Zavarzinia sp.]|nr:nucleoside triphosphate pyrophosphohydrolase family protein [Zavarzinia sp.]